MTIKGKIKNSIENGYSILRRYENDVKHIRKVYGDCRDDVIAEKIKEAAVCPPCIAGATDEGI